MSPVNAGAVGGRRAGDPLGRSDPNFLSHMGTGRQVAAPDERSAAAAAAFYPPWSPAHAGSLQRSTPGKITLEASRSCDKAVRCG